jgi:hypothetical protein
MAIMSIVLTILTLPSVRKDVAAWGPIFHWVGHFPASYALPIAGWIGVVLVLIWLTVSIRRDRRQRTMGTPVASASVTPFLSKQEYAEIAPSEAKPVVALRSPPIPEKPRSVVEQLAALYHDGTRRQRAIRLEWFVVLAPDTLSGRANEAQVQRERRAREWDDQVRHLLRATEHVAAWNAAASLPKAHPTRQLIEPTTSIADLLAFFQEKLAALRSIIESLGESSSSQ